VELSQRVLTCRAYHFSMSVPTGIGVLGPPFLAFLVRLFQVRVGYRH